MSKYFIVLGPPRGMDAPLPLVTSTDGSDILVIYDDLDSAYKAAEENIIGASCGYEIFKLGDGYS